MNRPAAIVLAGALVSGSLSGIASAQPVGSPGPEGPAPAPPAGPAPVPPPTPEHEEASATTAGGRARDAVPSEPEKLRFRHSWLTWDNAVNAQALGIGQSYQSADPTYEMSLSLQPRYYLYDGDDDAVFVDGRIDLIRELTNSDVTTREGETTFSDAQVLLAYSRVLAARGEYETLGSVRAPILTLPTSKFSSENGTMLGLGAELRLAQTLPLAGAAASWFQRVTLIGALGYNHTFTQAVVPTNPELRRVRLDPGGRTVPGDQLTGAAFPEHEGRMTARMLVDVRSRIWVWGEVSYLPTWKYGFGDVDVCVATGCAPADHPPDVSTYVVMTGFQAALVFDVLPELGASLGYVNVALQPGPDGQRRSIFTSPGAQVYFQLTAYLDAIYLAAEGRRTDFESDHHLHP
jgi:hypothetical protein